MTRLPANRTLQLTASYVTVADRSDARPLNRECGCWWQGRGEPHPFPCEVGHPVTSRSACVCQSWTLAEQLAAGVCPCSRSAS